MIETRETDQVSQLILSALMFDKNLTDMPVELLVIYILVFYAPVLSTQAIKIAFKYATVGLVRNPGNGHLLMEYFFSIWRQDRALLQCISGVKLVICKKSAVMILGLIVFRSCSFVGRTFRFMS